MPSIEVNGPKIASIEKKRELVEKLTQAMVDVYGLPKEAFTVLIRENNPENVGVGGQLVADRHRQ